MLKWSRLKLALLVVASALPTLVWAAGCATLKVPVFLPSLKGLSLGDNWYQRLIQYVVIGNVVD